VIANRQSAQRSRMRKLQYISDLEANVAGLQTDLNEMQPQVALVQSRHASAPAVLASVPAPQLHLERRVHRMPQECSAFVSSPTFVLVVRGFLL